MVYFQLKCRNASCGHFIRVSERAIGKRVKCPACGTVTAVRKRPSDHKAETPVGLAPLSDDEFVPSHPIDRSEFHDETADAGILTRSEWSSARRRRGANWPLIIMGVLFAGSYFPIQFMLYRHSVPSTLAFAENAGTLAFVGTLIAGALNFYMWRTGDNRWFSISLSGIVPALIYMLGLEVIQVGIRREMPFEFPLNGSDVAKAVVAFIVVVLGLFVVGFIRGCIVAPDQMMR